MEKQSEHERGRAARPEPVLAEPKLLNRTHWHPAFASALRLELEEYADALDIQEEVQLTRKPLEIDILIIRKKRNIPIMKNIAELFREHNIIEYKSPEDYFSIDDFYKVIAYACLYKTIGREVNALPLKELTISCVCSVFPVKLAGYLEETHRARLMKQHPGVYVLDHSDIVMQWVVVDELSPQESRFIRLLTRRADVRQTIGQFIGEYGEHSKDSRYEQLLNLIAETNMNQLMEVLDMSKTLNPENEQALVEALGKIQIGKRIREEGEASGEARGKETMARELFALGVEVSVIAKASGLAEAEIRKLLQ